MLPELKVSDVDEINKEVEESLKKSPNSVTTESIDDEYMEDEYVENEPRINLSKINFEDFLQECPPDKKQMDDIYHLFD